MALHRKVNLSIFKKNKVHGFVAGYEFPFHYEKFPERIIDGGDEEANKITVNKGFDNTTNTQVTGNPTQETVGGDEPLPWESDNAPDSDEAPYVSSEELHNLYGDAADDIAELDDTDDESLSPNDFGIDDKPVAPVKPSIKKEERHTGFHHLYYNDPSWSFS